MNQIFRFSEKKPPYHKLRIPKYDRAEVLIPIGVVEVIGALEIDICGTYGSKDMNVVVRVPKSCIVSRTL